MPLRFPSEKMDGVSGFVKPMLVAVLIFGVGFPGIKLFLRSEENGRRQTCFENLRMIALASYEYRADFNGTIPAVGNKNEGWADALRPYADWSDFQCPEGDAPTKARSNDYFCNSWLAGRLTPPTPESTILFGEGVDNAQTDAHLSGLPLNWRNDWNSPAYRHVGWANYAFADGHVQSLPPDSISKLEVGRPRGRVRGSISIESRRK